MYTDYTEENENSEENYYEDTQGSSNNTEKIKKILFFVGVFVVVLILIIVLVKSCSKDNHGETGLNDLPPSIVISRTSLTLEVGESYELFPDVLNVDEMPVVSWYSEASSIVSVSDDGVILANSEGTTNIVAFFKYNDQTYSSKCAVTVTSETIALESINIIQEEIVIKKGNSVLIELSYSPTNAKVEDLIFVSDNSSVATVSDAGYINAIDNGTTTITVKTKDGLLSDSVSVTVSETGTLTINPVSLQIKGLSTGLSVGTTSQVIYELLPETTTEKKLTWTSSNPSIATVDSNGLITGVKAGTCKIVASTSNNISSSIEVTVEANEVNVTGVEIVGSTSITMHTGYTYQIYYNITPSNATNKKVYFTSSNSSVVHVNSLGILSAQSAGNATITVISADGNKSANIYVNVVGETTSSSSTSSSSGSSSSSSSSGSSSTSSSSSSSSSTDVSCSPSLMTYISHNGSSYGAVVSSINFSKAKAFIGLSETPYIKITSLADCLDTSNITYKTYYGTSLTNNKISNETLKKSGKILLNSLVYLNQGNGYYRIEITGKLSNSTDTYTKNYYAIVGDTSSIVSLTAQYKYYNYSEKFLYINYGVNSTLSSTSYINFCRSTSSCTPSSSKTTGSITSTGKHLITNVGLNEVVCSAVFENGVQISNQICTSKATAPTISVTPNKVASTGNLELTPTLKTSGSGSAKIYYCSNTSTTCQPSTSSFKATSGNTYSWAYGSSVTYKYVCFQAIDSNSNRSQKICYNLETAKVVV